MQSQTPHNVRIADGCSLHEGDPFIAICRSCGSYMCKQCNEGGKYDSCQSCRAARERAAAPIAPRELAVAALLGHSWQLYKRNFVLVTLMMASFLGTLFALQLLMGGLAATIATEPELSGTLYGLSSLLGAAVSALLLVGVLRISLQLVRGEPAQLSTLFRGLDRVGALLLQWLVLYLGFSIAAVIAALPFLLGLFGLFAFASDSEASLPLMAAAGIGSLLVVLAMVYVGLGVSLSAIELVAQPRLGAFVALGNAWRLASGRRLSMFLASLVMLALVFAGALFCMVGLVFTLGLGALFYTTLYVALREGARDLT